MMHEISLAGLHHLLFLGLIAMLSLQLGLLKAPDVPVRTLAGLDRGYGLVALLILIVGAGRVLGPGKGWAFYEANPFFWAKLACFGLIGILSIYPSLAFIKWSRRARRDPAFAPEEGQRRAVTRTVMIEIILLAPLVVFAALMARWPF